MPLTAVIFDVDGVLANSEPLHCRAYQHILAGEGLTLTVEDYYARYLGYDDVDAFRTMGRDRGRTWGEERIAELVARKTGHVGALLRDPSVMFPGAADCVRQLAAELPLAIASGALRGEVETILDAAGLRDLFVAVVTAEDTPRSKPAPDPYLHALRLLGDRLDVGAIDPRRCVAVEDSRWGIASARAAGLRCVGVAQSYPPSELTAADFIVPDVRSVTLATLRRSFDGATR